MQTSSHVAGSATDETPPQPDQALPIRDVHLERAFADVPKYFADGDIVMSHMFAVLSATFPDAESYFVRSVAAVRDRITDEALASDIEGFIGQESMHGREHRAFNAHLAELGYPTRGIERYTDRAFRLFERVDNRRAHLGVTAALEHYTATLAEMLLTDPDARAVFEHDAVRACSCGTRWRKPSTRRSPSTPTVMSEAANGCDVWP